MELEELETGSIINTFETVVICKPDDYEESVNKISEACQEYTGTKSKIKIEKVGVKKLAYSIKETYKKGYYAILTWQGTSENVTELERLLRVDDNVIEFMTIKLEDAPALEEFTADEAVESEQMVSSKDAWDMIFEGGE